MKRLILAALGAAVLLLSGCGGAMTTAPASGIKLSTSAFPNQLPSPCPLPNATAGTAYSVTITASGGIPPYNWALAPGSSLPPGLALASGTPSATISGTPQQSGTSTFSLQLTDAEVPPVTASAEFSLTISPPPNPTPSVTSLSPSSATAGDPAFTLTVNGSSFVSGATVEWNGSARVTTFVSSTQLTAAIPATDIATAGTVQVTVVNPSPGGGTSNMIAFTVNNPVPAISSLSPSSAIANSAAFTLTVNGSSFVSGTTVEWNGSARVTIFVSSTQLTAAITATDIATAGTVQVTVVNPSPGGGASNMAGFTVNNPVPVISSISPSSAIANSAAFTLTVNGSGFVSGTTVEWNASPRTTTFVSSTQLTAAIPATDITAAATVNVTVVNPTPGGGTSNAVVFTIRSFPQIVSVATDGTQGDNGSATASVSADGRFVAFQSDAATLVAGDTNQATDVFLRDTCQVIAGPVAGCTPTTTLVSATPSGTVGNGPSQDPSISADGRFVAFDSSATNVVSGDTNGFQDVFVRDTCQTSSGPVASCTPSTTLVSVATDGTQGDNVSGNPSISADGRYVAFDSSASTLVANDNNQTEDIFVRDTCQTSAGPVAGCAPSTTLVSVATDGTQGNGFSELPSISADGRFVAFDSLAGTFGAVGTDFTQMYVHDTCAGAGANCAPSTTLISVTPTGAIGNGTSTDASISADGRFVAFDSYANNLVASDTNLVQDVFVSDTCQTSAGPVAGCTPSTVRVSVASDGTQGNAGMLGDFVAGSDLPSISADGRFIAFESASTNLVANDTNFSEDVFIHDTCAGVSSGCTPSTVRVSVASDGTQGDGGSYAPAISGDGHFVVFTSSATNLVAGDANGFDDDFLTITGF
jgi:trimeric autotransporter adhesin